MGCIVGGMQAMENITNPLDINIEWNTVEPLDHHTWHPAPEDDKVEALATDMEQRGWAGAPIVAWGDRAWTGTHRIAAWRLATEEYAVPAIQLADLLEAHGLDIDDYNDLLDYDEAYAVARMAADLPVDTRDTYGLDLEA